jgi:hypothetical protein
MNVPYILTKSGLTVYLGAEPREIDNSVPEFSKVLEVIKAGATDAAEQIKQILDAALNRVKQALVAAPASGVTLAHGQVWWNGQPLHNTLTDRMLAMLEQGLDIQPLIGFLENLMKNPSFRVVQKLYEFLEFGGLPITSDGSFLAYKAVRADWKDIHSGTFDNSIGKVLEIPRNQVDEDAERTCSYGLHVCSFKYLPNFAHSGGHIAIVKVNPADVVAIPADYNNTKMRCCRYEVVDELKDYYQTIHTDQPNDILRDTLVVDKYEGVDQNLADELANLEVSGATVTRDGNSFVVELPEEEGEEEGDEEEESSDDDYYN